MSAIVLALNGVLFIRYSRMIFTLLGTPVGDIY